MVFIIDNQSDHRNNDKQNSSSSHPNLSQSTMTKKRKNQSPSYDLEPSPKKRKIQPPVIFIGSKAKRVRSTLGLPDLDGRADVSDRLTSQQAYALFGEKPKQCTLFMCTKLVQGISILINEKQSKDECFIIKNGSFDTINSTFNLVHHPKIQCHKIDVFHPQHRFKNNLLVMEKNLESFINAVNGIDVMCLLRPSSRFIIEDIGLFNKIKHLFVHHKHVQIIIIHLEKDINRIRVLPQASLFETISTFTIPPISINDPSLV